MQYLLFGRTRCWGADEKFAMWSAAGSRRHGHDGLAVVVGVGHEQLIGSATDTAPKVADGLYE